MDWGTPSRDKVLSYLGQRALIKKIEAKVERRLLQRSSNNDRVQQATRDPYTWVTGHTETWNDHWVEEGRRSPYERFPELPYFTALFEIMEAERIVWVEKSRDMMLSWACVAYLTLNVMKVARRTALFQTQTERKAIQLVDYAKCLYRRQSSELQAAFPLRKGFDGQPSLELHFANGSSIVGIPGGANQIRSYHPYAYLNDESSFQPDAGSCFNEALSAVKGKIIFVSSANPGWFADARRDIIRSEEE
jgi:hypothetical protein